eukprot:180459-Pyramimonas_sp.AAC.1
MADNSERRTWLADASSAFLQGGAIQEGRQLRATSATTQRRSQPERRQCGSHLQGARWFDQCTEAMA